MKKLQIYFCLILYSGFLYSQNDTIKKNPEVKEVTVFLSGAQIKSSADINLSNGVNNIVFTDLSEFIDEKSIQVKVDDEVTILSVKYDLNYIEPPDKDENIKNLQAQAELLNKIIAEAQVSLIVYTSEASLLTENKTLSGTENSIGSEILLLAADLFRTRLTEITSAKYQINKLIDEFNEEIQKINNQIYELNALESTASSQITVSVTSDIEQETVFEISYVISNAGWTPDYDIRITNIASPIKLTYKAKVFQNSGYNWKNVKLFLSTGNPSETGTLPELAIWNLDFYNYWAEYYKNQNIAKQTASVVSSTNTVSGNVYDEDGMGIPGATIRLKDNQGVGTITDLDGYFSLSNVPANSILVASFVGLETKEINVYNQQYISAVLETSAQYLDEVVVTAIGISRSEKKLGYAATTISGDELNGYKDRNSLNSLQGKVAGVNISSTSGAPGSSTRVIFRGFSSDDLPVEPEYLNPVTENQTTVNFELKEIYSIPSDGKEHSFDIEEFDINSEYVYSAVPKTENVAFLMSKLTNWEYLNLLPGFVNLYFEGTYIGQSYIDSKNTKDTLEFSLGRDNNILISRNKIKDYTKTQLLGPDKKYLIGYEIVVKNNKSETVNLTIEDQIPVSQQKEIKVFTEEISEGILDEDTGKIKWTFSLEPYQNKTITLKYSVKCPKGLIIDLE